AMSNKIGEMSYRHSTVCEVDGNVVGLLHCFPLSFHKPPKVTMVPKERFEYLKPFYDVHIPNSLYLFTLAVIGEFQGQGIGAQLISIAKLRAQEHGFTSLSLHAWADNQKALELYKKSGFKVVKQCAIPRHPLLPHDNGMVLMQWAPDPSSNI
ncbi:MAG: GNAT family N-acetyltransferase, partial [Verrucomicrobia bacterium]|nr:GNAT family N-acetyltransferase [Verrucomicrobiota bacterium]